MSDLGRQLVVIQGLAAKLEANASATVEALNDSRQGLPRAAAYDSEPPAAEIWCDRHDRPIGKCRDEGEFCDGVTLIIHDPTGEAAIRPDGAAVDHKRYTAAITQALVAMQLADSIRAKWNPAHSASVTPDPDDLWCKSCMRDDGYCWPVDDNYRGKKLCRWCAEFFNNEGQMPPLSILRLRHQSKRITQQILDKAMPGRRRAS